MFISTWLLPWYFMLCRNNLWAGGLIILNLLLFLTKITILIYHLIATIFQRISQSNYFLVSSFVVLFLRRWQVILLCFFLSPLFSLFFGIFIIFSYSWGFSDFLINILITLVKEIIVQRSWLRLRRLLWLLN